VNKLLWDARMDSDALAHQFDVKLQGVIDLQISEVAFRRCVSHSHPSDRTFA